MGTFPMPRRGVSWEMSPLRPIAETAEALRELDPSAARPKLLTDLITLAERGQEVVPDLIGVSIARLSHGLTFTLVATAAEIAALDAVQYLVGGPCVDSAEAVQIREFESGDVLDEEEWRTFAEATAARAVRSTLTLPVVGEGGAIGTVNLYAASRRAFVGHHEQLAEVFGAWAAGAVANADLSFTTRTEAEAAPERIHQQTLIEEAADLLADQLGIDLDSAEAHLRDAALRAGVDAAQLARAIVDGHEQGGPEQG